MSPAESLKPFVFVILSGLALLTGCSDDPAKTCEATLCDASLPPTCSGNDVRRCVGGTAYSYTSCGAQQRCDDADGSAECVQRQCTSLGESTCKTPIQIEKCLDDGSGRVTIDCATTEKCLDGRCVDKDCQTGDGVCVENGPALCNSGVWTTSACAPGDVCTLGASGPACGPKVCVPGTFRCDGKSSRFCDARGTNETGQQCASGEVCVEGRCQAEVCGVDIPDATAGDTSDADTTLVPAQLTFKLAGQTITFDQSAFTEFDQTRELLTLEAQKGTRNVLMIIENARQTLTGTFTETTPLFKSVVCWNDGGPAQTFSKCPDGFTHQSTVHQIIITKNEGRGGRVEGSFSATVNDQNGDPTKLQDGTFVLNFR